MINAYYTVVLKELLDNGFDIGLKDYPIWDEEYRPILNEKIINHFLFREIGFETPALFHWYLNRTMHEIMPYYNQMYKTTIYEYNPIHNANYTEEYTLDRMNKSTVESTSRNSGFSSEDSSGRTSGDGVTSEKRSNSESNEGKNVKIDTPQSPVSIGGMNVDNVTYASEVGLNRGKANVEGSTLTDQKTSTSTSESSTSEVTNDTFNTGTSTDEKVDKYIRRLAGNYGVKTTQTMIMEERNLIINIDMDIINELESLFITLW